MDGNQVTWPTTYGSMNFTIIFDNVESVSCTVPTWLSGPDRPRHVRLILCLAYWFRTVHYSMIGPFSWSVDRSVDCFPRRKVFSQRFWTAWNRGVFNILVGVKFGPLGQVDTVLCTCQSTAFRAVRERHHDTAGILPEEPATPGPRVEPHQHTLFAFRFIWLVRLRWMDQLSITSTVQSQVPDLKQGFLMASRRGQTLFAAFN